MKRALEDRRELVAAREPVDRRAEVAPRKPLGEDRAFDRDDRRLVFEEDAARQVGRKASIQLDDRGIARRPGIEMQHAGKARQITRGAERRIAALAVGKKLNF